MPTDTLVLDAALTTDPATGDGSGVVSVAFPLGERLALKAKSVGRYTLTDDTPVAVQLGGVSEIHVLAVRVLEGGPGAVVLPAVGQGDPYSLAVKRTLVLTTPGLDGVSIAGAATGTTVVEVFLGELA